MSSEAILSTAHHRSVEDAFTAMAPRLWRALLLYTGNHEVADEAVSEAFAQAVGGRQPGAVLFVFPAPGFDRIPPGESRTFLLTAGEPYEGEPATDFSGSRIVIEVEICLRGREHPVSRTLAYPACPVPAG